MHNTGHKRLLHEPEVLIAKARRGTFGCELLVEAGVRLNLGGPYRRFSVLATRLNAATMALVTNGDYTEWGAKAKGYGEP